MIANGKIQSIGPAASAQIPQGAQLLDRSGYTVIPGIVGMHDHLYYTNSIAVQVAGGRISEPGLFVAEIPYAANVFVNVNPLESMDKMVEAGGVEPPSEKRYGPKPTCLAQFRFFRPPRSE